MPKPPKAVALISGGLDSMLAARVVMDQGVEVEGVNFFTGFCVEGHTQLGMRLHIIDVIEEYKDVVLNPRHGYGANLNPCLDCKVFMVRKAVELWLDDGFMDEHGFDFIVTGEVVGQRPKSQRRETLPLIARESGADDRLLRPLCAKLLPETRPEREGWVNRNDLYDFNGRSRKPQMALAAELGIEDWAQPAGGCCFLTDASYSEKLADLWHAQGERRYELDDIMLLKVGRHIRPAPHFKLIIGRELGENRYLEGYSRQFVTLRPASHKGPVCLIDGAPGAEDVALAAGIVGRYSQGRDADRFVVDVAWPDGRTESVEVAPLGAHRIPEEWLIGA
jgi:tRNA U34 2-thiouridine synthase MnmA/TrmU